jgi:hypothetical protein
MYQDQKALIGHVGPNQRGWHGMWSYINIKRLVWAVIAGALLVPLAWAEQEQKTADWLNSPTLNREADAFAQNIKSGALAAMSDHDVREAYKRITPEAIAAYLVAGIKPYNEYEILLKRQERLPQGWTDKPAINYIKYRHQPRQVYMKWLKGGPNAGQEMIYDETKRKDAMYAHFGGVMNVMSIWTSIDGLLAKNNSNHTVRDLGMQAIVDIISADRAQFLREGHRPVPDDIDIEELNHERTVVLTWKAPSGKPLHYAKKTKVYLDLKRPLVKQIEAWDDDGEMFERIYFERISPATFTDADFDPKNKDYAF